jgi:SAM-dependent methyltransferase
MLIMPVAHHPHTKVAQLLREYLYLLTEKRFSDPILDLATGDCHNAIFLAQSGLRVIACDISGKALARGRRRAGKIGVTLETWEVDLEVKGADPLPKAFYAGIIIFNYLHRPLIPSIRSALKPGGILIYETFTVDQPRFGRPRNPNYLLKPRELYEWFSDWEIVYFFEGIKNNPDRSVAQIVCRKTGKAS